VRTECGGGGVSTFIGDNKLQTFNGIIAMTITFGSLFFDEHYLKGEILCLI
jgi:hypothetical protein